MSLIEGLGGIYEIRLIRCLLYLVLWISEQQGVLICETVHGYMYYTAGFGEYKLLRQLHQFRSLITPPQFI